MTFHKTNRMEYDHSGWKLHEETLQTLPEYFGSSYDTQMNDANYYRSQQEKV